MRDVVDGDRFDVLQTVPSQGTRPLARRSLEGVERHPDGCVADGVDVDLEPGRVHLADHRL